MSHPRLQPVPRCCRYPLVSLLAATAALSVRAQDSPLGLAAMSLEELGNIEITSVSKRAERLADAPTAVHVVTASQIRRSGAANLPEALRLAPNLFVGRVSASGWVVSARGFNSQSANKLLVLIDGRSVYTPFFAGVFWDVQDLMLEDIERIEVISGPGGTLWGVNAVNGIINVITRSAAGTDGSLLAASAGNQEGGLALRHGGKLGEDAHFRVYAKAYRRRHTETERGTRINDEQNAAQVGARLDWQHGSDRLMLSTAVYDGDRQQAAPGNISTGVPIPLGDVPTAGGHLLVRWDRSLDDDGAMLGVQAYVDSARRIVTPTFSQSIDIADLQLQHSFAPSRTHALVWGAQLRHARDRITNSQYISFLPGHLNQDWTSLFAQDEITLTPRLKLTLGARHERNDYTGGHWLPSARLGWKPAPDHLVWAALSRAVRAPSRLDRDIFIPSVVPGGPDRLRGGALVREEIAKVFEVGYRGRPSASTSLSASAFHADYDHLRTQQTFREGSTAFAIFASGMRGTVQGLEVSGAWQVMPSWRLQAGGTRLWQDFELKPGSNDPVAVRNVEGATAQRQWQLRSAWDLGPRSELDVAVRHVSRLAVPVVPAYTALDLRWAWRPAPQLELSITGQNLTGGGHGEFAGVATRTEIGRSWLLKLLWGF
ncbi:TonB-dependent receptor [Aquincola sp. S2]|uniref:TonB-dependent receptor n=1 Tax=Pseudaquabacterium terrae TaxID=2732868 RepID=A0ABX2EDM3_9BURK|nr:TonB-dependent receptor [Aquabacterium terrae]NRF66475.1 TonB-dependent receptor [Aquabacterium terrae]